MCAESIIWDKENKELHVGMFVLDEALIRAVYYSMCGVRHPDVDLDEELKRYNG